MKNPLKYLKHIVKDPINTIAEADARKKEIMPWLFGSIALAVVANVLGGAVDALSFLTIFGLIGIFATMFFGFLLFVANSAKKRFEVLTCDKCNTLAEIKTPEAFAKYISFAVEKDEAVFKGYSGNKQPTDGVYSLVSFSASSKALVAVDITCPHCGKVRHLKYSAEPFKCSAQAKKVGALAFPSVRMSLETAVRTAVNDYNDPNRRALVPYTFHSSKNPNFERRTTFKGANASDAHPNYMGARIDYRKDVSEMLEHYFVINELNGTLYDPAKAKK